VLGLEPFVPSKADISSAFRRMSLVWHPDRNKAPTASAKFQQIKEASLILLSDTDRKNYDSYLRLKREAQERIEKQGADRKKVVEELLRREREYKEGVRRKREAPEQEEEFRKVETELERIVREIRAQEQEERKEQKEKKRKDHVSEHFDKTTIRLKPKSDAYLSQDLLRALLGEFGIIDGVIVEQAKAFVMFRHRDSALKVMNARDNEGLRDFKLKLVSTSQAQDRQEKKRTLVSDPIEKLRAKFLLGEGRLLFMKPLEELEEEVFGVIRNIKKRRM